MGNASSNMSILTTVFNYFFGPEKIDYTEKVIDVEAFFIAVQSSIAAYKSSEEIESVLDDRTKNTKGVSYWPMLKYVVDFKMFADLDTDAHCSTFIYNRDGRRTMIVAFRGTEKTEGDFLADAYFKLEKMSNQDSEDVMVDSGFQNQYNVLRTNLRHYLQTKKFDHLFITGHSLGGALATLCTADLAINKLDDQAVPCTFITVASPRVGDAKFESIFRANEIKLTRLVLQHDPVPKVEITENCVK